MKLVYLIIITAFFTTCFGVDEPAVLPGISIEEQFEVDTTLIEEYLMLNEIEAEVHSSGIRYVVETEGTGISPSTSDEITVKYEGWLLSDQRFDINRNGATFLLGSLIPAWQIMIPEMKEGGKMTIYTPSVYGYANTTAGTIPANSVLIFNIELVEVPL